jgi:flagellar basal body L-ring protein FlgH
MKKLVVVSLMFLLCSVMFKSVSGSDYESYQEITFEHKGATLLSEYGNNDFKKYYAKMKGKRFWGWRTFTVYKDEELSFIDDTLYVIVNEGTTAIDETIKLSRNYSLKKQYTVSGSLGIKANGTEKGFKLGLEEEIDSTISTTVSGSVEESYSMRIEVDPGTKVSIQIKGEGKITNGVAKYYRFWKNVKKGGFEIFWITTEYYSIEKVKIDEN